jgi:uncharacterized protein (TIGR03086 family)
MTVDITGVHDRALDYCGQIVSRLRPGQMGLPTPCEGWDVRTLVNHVVSGNYWAAELASGNTIEGVGDRFDGDVAGDDWAGRYADSAKAASAAFRAPGALDALCAVSYGPVPGRVYAGHRFIDVLIHGWDLAKASGQDTTMPPDLVAACIEVVDPQLPMLESSGMFGNRVGVPDGADEQTKLLAMLGRDPG